MAIIAKAGGDFTPAPEGTWQGVCVDVVDKGMVTSEKYGKTRHMIQVRWVLDAEPPLENGKPHMAVRSFGLTLGEKSNLRPFLEAWRGKKFTEDELAGFDIEKLIGANGQIQILHTRANGTTYGNVHVIMPLGKGMAKMEAPRDYVRECDREGYKAPEMPGANGDSEPEPYQPVEEDIPF